MLVPETCYGSSPALATAMSKPPNSLTAVATAASRSARLRTSHLTAAAWYPAIFSWSTDCWALLTSRSASTTCQWVGKGHLRMHLSAMTLPGAWRSPSPSHALGHSTLFTGKCTPPLHHLLCKQQDMRSEQWVLA